MAPKDKKAAPAPAVEEPAAKKAKAEEEPKKEEPKKEDEKEPEPKFQEPDAPKDSRAALKEQIIFECANTTLNVLPTAGGKLLTSITEAGMGYLLAGARANVAAKAGRYMFEAKIMQLTDPSHFQNKNLSPKLRIGFSLAESGLVMGDHANSCVYFDSAGFCMSEKKRTNLPREGCIYKDNVVAVVLNLDSKSPNNNTVALYRDGVAIADPVPLPEELHGKPLYPHVCYRSCIVQVNFGPTALKALPFQCRLLQGAAAADVEVAASKVPKDGKYEVVVPVAFPDEGTFDWLDGFLEKNPKYVELSDRKIFEWARQSGLYTKWGGKGNSLDKPTPNFGVPELDNMSMRRLISAVAPTQPRNYLVMEVKSNLIASERKETLKRFNYPCYKKVARVVMGEPTKDFKERVQAKILKDKQNKAEKAWKQEKAEKEKQRLARKAQREGEKKRKQAEKQRAEALAAKKKEEEEKRKAEEEAKKAAEEKTEEEKKEDDKKEDDKKEEDNKEEDKKEEEKKDEEKKEEEKKEEETTEEKKDDEKKEEAEDDDKSEEEPEDMDTEPPKVELTDEEKAHNFVIRHVPDVHPQVMSSCYTRFATPEAEEGFDDIQYEWAKGDQAAQYLKEWVLKKKLTSRIEDIKPGQEFKDKLAEFQKLSREWQDKQRAHRAAGKGKAAKKAEEGEDEEEEVDVSGVTDVCDVGEGVPLFESFGMEDWELLLIRFELAALAISFKKDANDEDRTGIPFEHLGFYYSRYFNKPLEAKRFGFTDLHPLITLVKDSVTEKDSLINSVHEDLADLSQFVKITEETRRDRQRRIDAGDETARLKIQPAPLPGSFRTPPPAQGGFNRPPAVDGKGKGKDFKGPGGKFGGKDFNKGFGKDMKGKDMKGGFVKGKGKF